jgi:integrase
MALSTFTVAKLKPPKVGRREVLDHQVPGFGVRITERGVKSWFFIYRSPTKRKRVRVTIGRVGEIDLETAREQARQLRAQIRTGQEPTPATVIIQGHGTLFRDVIELYAKRHLAGTRSGWLVHQIINRELMPVWGNKPLAAITRGDVLERVEALIDKGSPAAARRLFAIIRRLFNWSVHRQTFDIDRSPCDRLRPTDIVGRQTARSRILTDDELRALWRATGKMGYPSRPIVRLLLLTGLRRMEVAQARWSEFSPDKAVWIIPRERMKGDAVHVVPLTGEMLAVINELPRINGNECLFTSGLIGDRPVSGFTELKEKLDQLMGTATDWVIHDLRRTVRTHLSSLPVPGGDLVRELMMAHARPGLHKVYDQFGYLEERRRGYELWAERLMEIVQG